MAAEASPIRATVSREKYEAVRQQMTGLEVDALLMESTLKKKITTLKSRLKEAQNGAKWMSDRVSVLEEEVNRLKAENTELLRHGGGDIRKKYTHALKLLRDVLEEKTRDTEINAALMETVIREAARGHKQLQAPGRGDNQSNTSSSQRTTTRPLPSPAPSFDEPPVISGGSGTPANSSLFRSDTPPKEIVVSDSDNDNRNATWRHSNYPLQGGLDDNSFDDMYVDESEEGGFSGPIGIIPTSIAQNTYRLSELSSSPTSVASSEIVLHRSYHQGSRPWVYWRQPPGCVLYTVGPYTIDELSVQMKLKNEEVNLIQALAHVSLLGLNLLIHQLDNIGNVAFLHRPMFYDADGKTYLVSWAESSLHGANLEYLRPWTLKQQAQGRRPIIHVLTSPDEGSVPSQLGWWYFCAMKWKVVDLPSVWGILGADKKEILVDHLFDLWRGSIGRNEIAEKLASGELKQLTVELKSVAESYASAFASNVLGINPDPSAG